MIRARSGELPLAVSGREGSEGDTLGCGIDRIDRQLQDVQGINTLRTVAVHKRRINIHAAVEILVSAPLVVVAFADTDDVRMGVGHGSRLAQTDSQAIDTVATQGCLVALLVLAVYGDSLSAPGDYFARSNRRCVMVVESNTFLQNRGDDAVAAVLYRGKGVIDNR